MDAFLSFLLLNLHTDSLAHAEKIETTINGYCWGSSDATLITNDLIPWNDVIFSFPLEIRRLDNMSQQKQIAGAFIFDVRAEKWTPELLKPLLRNANSKYIMVTIENNTAAVAAAAVSARLCHVLMITLLSDKIHVSSLKDPCKGIGGFPQPGFSCQANVSFFDYPPDIIFTGNRLSGTEGQMMQTVADHLGIQLTYVNRHEIDFGEFEPPSGLNGDVASGRSIGGLGVLYATTARAIYTDFAFGCGYTQWTWAVPVAAAPQFPTWFVILVSEFSKPVWISAFMAYLLLVPTAKLFGWKDKPSTPWPFHILALVLGVPQNLILHKALTLAVVFFGFLLTGFYQAIMGSKLTLPSKIPEISTLRGLADSELRLFGPLVIGMILNVSARAFPEDYAKFELSRRYEPSNQSLDVLLPRIVNERDIAYLRHRNFVYSHAQKDVRTAGRIHIVEEASLEFLPATLIPKYSCLTDTIQHNYYRLCQSGLGSKWITDSIAKDTPIIQKGPRKLAMEHIQGFLYLLIFGWILSFIVFLLEKIAVPWFRKLFRTSRQKVKRAPSMLVIPQ